MIDLYKYSKKNKFYKFIIHKILNIDTSLMSKNFYYKDNLDLNFEESFFYNYQHNNSITKWMQAPYNNQHYQSEHDLNKLKELKKQVKSIENFMNTKIKPKILNINSIGKFKIKSMWFTIQKKNEAHSSHNHPKSILSGVYYFNIDNDCGGAINIELEKEKIKCVPKKNDFLVFNSNTFHSVDAYNGKNDRIAVAWDAIYSF